jgi:hypothetical protein
MEHDQPLTPAELLAGYQALCREVNLPAGDSISACRASLRSILVNIANLIDARRTGREVKLWTDARASADYTCQPDKMIDKEEAKAYPGILANLLRELKPTSWGAMRSASKQKKRKGKKRAGEGTGVIVGAAGGVQSGRVEKSGKKKNKKGKKGKGKAIAEQEGTPERDPDARVWYYQEEQPEAAKQLGLAASR